VQWLTRVGGGSDVNEAHRRLMAFLDTFQSAYEGVAGADAAGVSLDRLYGDLTEVILSLLNTIDRHAVADAGRRGRYDSARTLTCATTVPSEVPDRDGPARGSNVALLASVVNKALNVADLILRDEKYRRVVAETPHLLSRVLALLERLDSTEAKMLALRVISTLGQSADTKLEIGARAARHDPSTASRLQLTRAHRPTGRLEGFRKILLLLVDGDAELTQEIVRTVRQLLDVPQVASLASEAAEATGRARSSSTSFFTSTLWLRPRMS
jgi:hypothetical protein